MQPEPHTPSVLAIVTHFDTPEYLVEATASLCAQTRPPDAILVIDDASRRPPRPELLDARVSLYRSAENVGTFGLIDSALHRLAHDWVLIHDSDDIAAPTRVERLLDAGLSAGADMVGSALLNFGAMQEAQLEAFDEDGGERYLAGGRNWFCPWGGALLRRSLWQTVGGLSGGLRLGADTEFLHRAVYAGKIINVASVELHRRRHPASLTSAPDTGVGSAARNAERARILERSAERRRAYRAGEPLDLTPLAPRPPVPLHWIAGPRLRALDP